MSAAPERCDSEIQGIALGLHAAALSAPEPRRYKSRFTCLEDCAFMS
jgi:hypothetical protein